MKSVFKILSTFVLLFLLGCSSVERRNSYREGESERPLVDEKYSLTSDRKQVDDLRGQVPPERKKENDELALVLSDMVESKLHPNRVREKFNKATRKKRELFDKDLRKEREQFTKLERKARESFLKQATSERKNFLDGKPGKEQRDEFIKNQSDKRSEFFSDEREKRADFESDVRERRRNFEDYIREKTNAFNQEYREYYKRWEEMKKEKNSEKILNRGGAPSPDENNEVKSFLQELEDAKGLPGTTLESGE